jgi:F-type H+-transporting ATPase subunit gamma
MEDNTDYSNIPLAERRKLAIEFAKKAISALTSLRKITSTTAYTIEPSPEAVFNDVLPKLANVLLYHALLEAKASEHSARMVAMKSATDKAGELSHTLMLQFNKLRQAAITREVSEITSGIEAMK